MTARAAECVPEALGGSAPGTNPKADARTPEGEEDPKTPLREFSGSHDSPQEVSLKEEDSSNNDEDAEYVPWQSDLCLRCLNHGKEVRGKLRHDTLEYSSVAGKQGKYFCDGCYRTIRPQEAADKELIADECQICRNRCSICECADLGAADGLAGIV